MGKKLIGCHCVDQYICKDEKKIYVGKAMILTPGVKDYLRNKGVAIVYGEVPEKEDRPSKISEACAEKVPVSWENSKVSSGVDVKVVEKVMIKIMEILKGDYRIEDEEKIKELSLKILNRVNLN